MTKYFENIFFMIFKNLLQFYGKIKLDIYEVFSSKCLLTAYLEPLQ